MKKTLFTFLLAVLVCTTAVPSAFATCQQGGICHFGGCTSYDYAYNGGFTEANCGWSFYNGAIWNTSGNTMCSYVADHYARFTKNGTQTNPLVRQYVTIPGTETKTHWAASWNIEVLDPNVSASNTLTISVVDTTTSTTVGSMTYYGNGTNPDCRQDSFFWTGTFSNHTFEIRMQGSVQNTNTDFRVTNVQLISY